MRSADENDTVELVGPRCQECVGGGAEEVERLRGGSDLIDRDISGIQRSQLGVEGTVEGAVGDAVEHHDALEVGILRVTSRSGVVGGRRAGETATRGVPGEDECALEFADVTGVSGGLSAGDQGRATVLEEQLCSSLLRGGADQAAAGEGERNGRQRR